MQTQPHTHIHETTHQNTHTHTKTTKKQLSLAEPGRAGLKGGDPEAGEQVPGLAFLGEF